jgi:hypothetical protein
VFGFFKRLSSKQTSVDYSGEWRRLRDAYADPAIELAKTKQALLVSASSVLDRLWNGNGGLGWDESCEIDYVAPLREHLATDEMFSTDVRAQISRKLDEMVALGGRNLRAIEAAGEEETMLESAGVDIDYIVERTVDWCRRHPDPIPIADEEEYRGHF